MSPDQSPPHMRPAGPAGGGSPGLEPGPGRPHSRRVPVGSRSRFLIPILLAVLLVAGGAAAAVTWFGQPTGSSDVAAEPGSPWETQVPDPGGPQGAQDEPEPEPEPEPDPTVYDIVIAGGRVMDPETRRDETGLNVGIIDDTIVRITRQPLQGKRVIDAQGLVVAPGFIDPQSYDPNPFGNWYKIADGVTTNLAGHDGLINPAAYFDNMARQQPPLNYGASFYVGGARRSIGVDRYAAATPEQIQRLVAMAERALEGGAMAVSFSLEYYPNQQPDEVLALVEVAARYGVPAIFHLRYSTMYGDGGNNFDALEEVLDYARATGAAIHIGHLHSTGGTFSMPESLALLAEARREGIDVTADVYSYHYWATNLSSARFAPGWQERFQIDYSDLQLVCSTERL